MAAREFRFAVGIPGVCHSLSWKLWQQSGEVYLVCREHGATKAKFSFHKSGKCHYAFNRPGPGRFMQEWHRGEPPPVGEMGCTRLASLAFPTNHLSTSPTGSAGNVAWITPAPAGKAVGVDIWLTRERDETVASQWAPLGMSVRWSKLLPSGVRLLVSSLEFDCGPVEIRMPDAPGLPGKVVGEMQFPDVDTRQTGRPVRLHVALRDGVPPQVWELGGYLSASAPDAT